MNWTILVLVICLLLAAFVLWKEGSRVNKACLLWRIIASFLAVIALACIALPISYEGQTVVGNENQAVLITPGSNADSIKKEQPGRLFTLDRSIQKAVPGATLLNNIGELATVKPTINQLTVFGFGLTENELQQLNQMPISFHPSKDPGGIEAINWNNHLKTGEELRIQGSFANTTNHAAKIVLRGLNTSLDSTSIPAHTTQNFELKTIPKPAGQVIYNLTAFSGKDTVESEDLPVEIEKAKPLKLLLLASSPDFENKFLVNWLSQNGYAFANRTTVSKNKLSYGFVNIPKVSLKELGPSVLSQFDVVISDLSSLNALGPAEKSALKQQVEENGLGIIVKADSAGKTDNWPQKYFRLDKIAAKTQLTTALSIQGKPSRTEKLNIDPFYISSQGNIQPVIADDQNRALAACQLAGAGKVLLTTLNSTYNWMLSGNSTDYTSIWSALISKAVRKSPPAGNVSFINAVPSVNDEVHLQLESAVQSNQILANNWPVFPQQGAYLPFIQNISFWPENKGWQQVKLTSGEVHRWYAYAVADWKGLRALKNISDTRAYAAANPVTTSVTKPIHQAERIEVPKIYFYLVLLAALTFFWAEAKFST